MAFDGDLAGDREVSGHGSNRRGGRGKETTQRFWNKEEMAIRGLQGQEMKRKYKGT